MSIPSQAAGGGIGQAASELMQEMQKATAEIQKLEEQNKVAGNPAFQQALESQSVQKLDAEHTTTNKIQSGAGVLAQAREHASGSPQVASVGATEKAEDSKLAQMIERITKGSDKMQEIVNMAMSGKQFSPTELIGMQAQVYQFTQELDLTSKVVEKATAGIKQTLNTQV